MGNKVTKGPSEHLYWTELACHDGTPYPGAWRSDRAIRLAANFEDIRVLLGAVPLVILSGYRTESWNHHVEGAVTSQHVQGRAVDIWHPTLTPGDAFERIREAYEDGNLPLLGGLGLYRTFVHTDVRPRPTKHLATWYGMGVLPR